MLRLKLATRGKFAFTILARSRRALSNGVEGSDGVLKSDSGADGRCPAAPESYQRAKRGVFFQAMPQLHNPFIEDPYLRTCLSNILPAQVSSRNDKLSPRGLARKEIANLEYLHYSASE